MLDGRVKTLHPKIHAGILHDRQNKLHKNEMSKLKFPSIDLIIVNFYPFQEVVKNTRNPKTIIDNIFFNSFKVKSGKFSIDLFVFVLNLFFFVFLILIDYLPNTHNNYSLDLIYHYTLLHLDYN